MQVQARKCTRECAKARTRECARARTCECARARTRECASKCLHSRTCKGVHSRKCECVYLHTSAHESLRVSECAQLIRTFRPFIAFIPAILRQLSDRRAYAFFSRPTILANNWRLSLLYNPRIRCPRSGQKKIL